MAFMLVGALLVGGAYLVGKTEKDARADLREFENVEITGTLIVKGRLLVGDTDACLVNAVLISADKNGPHVGLDYQCDPVNKTSTANILITATATDKGQPIASIQLYDKLGNNLTGTAFSGWGQGQLPRR